MPLQVELINLSKAFLLLLVDLLLSILCLDITFSSLTLQASLELVFQFSNLIYCISLLLLEILLSNLNRSGLFRFPNSLKFDILFLLLLFSLLLFDLANDLLIILDL